MPKTTSKREITVKVNIKPVKLAEVTLGQRQLYRRFWVRLISLAKDGLKDDR